MKIETMFVCPDCKSTELIMQQQAEVTHEISVTTTNVEAKEIDSEQSTIFRCKHCGHLLPCGTKQELMDYIKERQPQNKINYIDVKRCNGVFIVEQFSGDFSNGWELQHTKKVRYTEELVELLFSNPEANVKFIP